MNTANLQLEGLYLAIAGITNALVTKGLLTREEVNTALRTAEQSATSDYRSAEDLSPANRDAIAFPARLLVLANSLASGSTIPSFAALAKMVGETKAPYNDQR